MISTASVKKSRGRRAQKALEMASSFAVVVLSIGAYRTIKAGDPLTYMIPNAVLMTPFHRYAVPIWNYLDPTARLPEKKFKHKQVRSMEASNYTFDKFVELTEGFRYPAVVKGLFKNTTALEKWTKDNYLTDKIGHFDVKVAWRTANETKVFDRTKMSFKEAYSDLLTNEDYKGWLFFPFFSSTKAIVAANPLNRAVNKLVQDDLDVDRIWKGFGNYDTHGTFIGHQFSMGRAKKGQQKGTTTFDWHCEPGSNWFIQVSGTKEWWFMDPKYSSYMMTNHTGVGIRVLRTSNGDLMRDLHDLLPLETYTLQPGDLLYNPEWEWHTVKKDEGISVAVAMREFNYTNAFNLNAAYTSVIAINHFWKNIGLEALLRKDWWLF